jgi:serine/threonine protein kinase
MNTTKLDEPPTMQAEIDEQVWTEPPSSIPARYEILSQVGTGGMAVVYKVHDRETDDIIALKVLKSGMASDPAMQENLKREVCLARKVTHRNVCRIHEYGRSNGTAYVTMEFVEGQSLLLKLRRAEPLPWNEALRITRQICLGLREAHVQGIVHRDLKPANIMMDHNGDVKIMDFGIARLFQGTGQMTRTLVGTPAYMAPEQVELMRTDARTDIYALGLLLYEMVTGVPAFEGETPIAVALKQLREFPTHPRKIVPALAASAEAVILKCLQKDPRKRFQSVDELAAALNRQAQPKPAVSMRDEFVRDFRFVWRDSRRILNSSLETGVSFLRRQDWRALLVGRVQKTVAVGFGAACLVALIGFSVRSHAKSFKASSAPAEAAAMLALQSSHPHLPQPLASNGGAAIETHSASDANAPISVHDVDLTSPSGLVSETQPPSSVELTDQPPSDSKIHRAKQDVKAQPPARTSASSAAKRVPPQTSATNGNPSPQSAATSPASTARTESSSEPKTEVAAVEPSPSVAAAVAPKATPAAADAKPESTTPAAAPASTASYLEVGSFKDSAWADEAVGKLTQLGFHAVSVPKKNLLLMHSFEVQVGPYTKASDLEAARKNLAAKGFKPHAVK